MTREQVDEAYGQYRKLVTSCELVDMRQAEAFKAAYGFKADLEHCERQCARAWQHYERCLRALQSDAKQNESKVPIT